jgi:acetyl-CoA carboxylase biotin carboxyl carrier protein
MAGSGPHAMMALPLRPMSHVVVAELVANVLSVEVVAGQRVEATQAVVVLESMKMEIPVLAEVSGTVSEIVVAPGDVVRDGDPLVVIDAP